MQELDETSCRVPLSRFLLASNRDDADELLIGIGLVQAFRSEGLSVSVCVLGPHLLLASLMRRLTNRYVRCLDPTLLSSNQILESLYQASLGADLVMILGAGGLFDTPMSGGVSDARFAYETQTPILLLADSSRYREGIATLLHGFYTFEPGLRFIGGIIHKAQNLFSNFSNARAFYEDVCHGANLPTPFGVCPEIPLDHDLPPPLVSQTTNLVSLPRKIYVDAANLLSENVNITAIAQSASSAPDLSLSNTPQLPSKRRVRIAVSDDACFQVCFQDNLDLLRFYGADLVSFSPLADQSLPDNIGAVYITGAFLSDYGVELQANSSLRAELSQFATQGGVIFAEGAGSAYMSERVVYNEENEAIDGVGLLQGTSQVQNTEPAYMEGTTIDDTVLGNAGTHIGGYNSGDWVFRESGNVQKLLRVESRGMSSFIEGYSPGPQMFLTFNLLHFGSCPIIAQNIVDAAEVHGGRLRQ